MSAIETVVFDLDTTLCENTQSDEEIHETVFARVGIEPPFTVEDVQNVDPADIPTVDTDRAFYEELYRAVTDDLDHEGYRRLAEVTVDVVDETDVEFREGAREAVEYARERYDDLGMLTYGDPDTQRAKLDVLDIAELFDAVVVCGPNTEVAGKPDPDAFETVLRELGAVPETSIYVGDSLRGDIGGANNAGMQSAWVPDEEPPADPDHEPTYVLSSPADVREIL
ncbi:HAD family hydrolase [Halovenus salina]|uniref:HAD family hydrolase n=1 Tax=Halovenus salina TaxID=1510225 RepID=A0ABD5W1C2_9EURY|nr:HAD family hydrolase [Halovenus salina]